LQTISLAWWMQLFEVVGYLLEVLPLRGNGGDEQQLMVGVG
jgi:hypothetical protein